MPGEKSPLPGHETHESGIPRELQPGNSYVLVVGGSRGIGAATAILLAEKGYNLAITYNKSREKALATLKEVEKRNPSGRHKLYKVDVASHEEVKKLALAIQADYPYLNGIVYSAGILQAGSIEDLTIEEWDTVLRVNLYGAFYTIKYTLPALQKAPWASIVLISSIAGETGNVVAGAAYSASKAGLIGLAKRLAVELAEHGIRVNAVAPSFVETDMTRRFLEDPHSREKIRNLHPLKIILQPEDVARAIHFLLDPVESRGITGHILSINAGRRT